MLKPLFLDAWAIYHQHWGIHEVQDRTRGVPLLHQRLTSSDNLQNLLFLHELFRYDNTENPMEQLGEDLDELWRYIRTFADACLGEDYNSIQWVEEPYERLKLGIHAPIKDRCLDVVSYRWRNMGCPLLSTPCRDSIYRVYAIVA